MSSSLAYPGIQDLIISTQQLWSSNKITAAIAAAVDPTMKAPEAFAPAGTYPVTYGGAAVEKGDTFRITAPGTMGAITVNTEDLLIALIDTPAQVDANWMVAESNRDQATETVKGVAELATQVEADAGTNDTNIMTPLKTATAPVRAHDIDPAAGPHTGGLPEASSEFDDATGHKHTGAAGNGTVVAHSDTSGKTTDDHHAKLHAGDHVNGTDDIQNATNGQKGLATAAQITLLEKLENMPINDQSGTSYTFVLADKDKNVRFDNAASITATVPPNSSVAYPIGAKLFGTQVGAGQVTFAEGSGVTLNGELSITDQWLAAGLIKVATDEWDVIGGTGSSAPEAHAASHTDGSDDIQNATSGQKGLATAAQITKLDAIEALADVTDWTNVAAALAAAAGNVDVNAQAITNVGNVDGRDVSADGSALDSHVADTANPHGTDVENLGSGTLAELNSALTDATLDDSGDERDPAAHAAEHTDGTDDIQNATSGQKGLATAAQITKLDGIDAGADVTGDEIELERYQASEVVTGYTWNSAAVYRKSITGAQLADDVSIVASGAAEIVNEYGFVTNDASEQYSIPTDDGTNSAKCYLSGGAIKVKAAGDFEGAANNAYRITVEYTKS